jgi:4-amino-4-deoxy-L-arabinose transferase-like glycosyltransferase
LRLIALSLIVLAGLALRVDHAWQGPAENLPDSAAYERIARGLHEDGSFEQAGPGTPAHPQPASNYSPGLPLLAAAVFEVTGDDHVRLVRLLLALVSTLAIPLAFLIGRRLGGDTAGLAGAAIVAFYPTLVVYSEMLLTEPLAGTLVAGGVLAVLRARDGTGLAPWFGAGVLFGLAAMVRPEYLLVSLVVALALMAIEIRGGVGHALRPVSVMLLALVLVVAPWTARNTADHGRFVPLSTGGGQTVFSGSYVPSGGNPTKVMPAVLERNPDLLQHLRRQNAASGEGPESITPERVFTLLAAERHPGLATDAALARMGRERYLAELRSDPAGLMSYFWRKTLRIWWRAGPGLLKSGAGRAIQWAIVLAAIFGLASLLARRRPEFWVLAAMIVCVTLIGVLLVATPRRALVLVPVVSALAGVGLATAGAVAAGRLQRRRGPVGIP